MGVKQTIASALDRPGLRGILSRLATWEARRRTSRDVAVFYDGAWIHRLDDTFLVVSRSFRYRRLRDIELAFRSAQVDGADYWFHVYKPRPADVIVDIGAGIGGDILLFSQAVGKEGRVIAVEAHPATYAMLETQVRLNRLTNVTTLHCAIMDVAGTVYIDNRNVHQANTVCTAAGRGKLSAGIAAVTLDELCRTQGIEAIDFLKMNVEGAERLAIRGMEETIERTRHVCIACHDFLAEGGEEGCCTMGVTSSFLREKGFDLSIRGDDPRDFVRCHVHGTRLLAASRPETNV